MINIGIIGSGNMAWDMAKAFLGHDDFKILAIADIDKEKGQRMADAFSCRYTSSHHELLADQEIDLAYIATPPSTHAEIFIDSLSAKKHVLCEKPLCLFDEEALAMKRASKMGQKFALVSAINYPMAFIPALAAMTDLLREIGEIRHVEIKLHFPIWPRPILNFAPHTWINDREHGGILREISSHFLFALCKLFPQDPVMRICSSISYPNNGSETGGIAILEHSSFLTSLSLASSYAHNGEEIFLRIYGSNKTLSLENFQILKVADKHEALHVHPCSLGIDEKAFMKSDPLIFELKRAIENKNNLGLVSIAMGAYVQKLLNAIICSKGRWIAIDQSSES